MADTKLTLATRRSMLALAQSRAFAAELVAKNPGLVVDELQMVTAGDRTQDRPLMDIGGKGLFVKELEEALLDGRAHFAVHSIKDVPGELLPGLHIAAIPLRADPRDVLVSREGHKLADLPPGARVGTSSLRRAVAIKAARPDLVTEAVRGNVDTRIRKLQEGQFDAIVLARAGLVRLGREAEATEVLEPEVSLPAVGQGALGIETRVADEATERALGAVVHDETTTCVRAERAVMLAVNGNCRVPIAAYAVHDGEEMWLRGMLADEDGGRVRRGERRVAWPGAGRGAGDEAERVGRDLGAELLRA